MAGITWLHLSDWHQKSNDVRRTEACNALMKDIRERAKNISTDLKTIDFIVFNGDVAYSGHSEEYETAITQFFDPLLKATNVKRSRLFIVPGNHDMEWAVFEWGAGDLLQKFNTSEKVNEWLDDERKRRALLQPLEHYSQFITKYLGKYAEPEPAYGYCRSFKAGSKEIAIIGLNSAWLSGRNKNTEGKVDDRGHLIVGESQVHKVLNQAQKAEVRIAVLHHPFYWLVESDQVHQEERLYQHCHFILHGHEHLPRVKVIHSTVGSCVIIPAGASYDRYISPDPRFVNAYNFVHLDFESGEGTVYLRRWNVRNEKWIADSETYNDGKFRFTLPKDLGKKEVPLISLKTTASVSEKSDLLPRLREWKYLHTEMQSLFDKVTTVTIWLTISQPNDQYTKLEKELQQVEIAWRECIPRLKAILTTFKSFQYIREEVVVTTMLDQASKADNISRQIGEAKTYDNVKSLAHDVGSIKNDIYTALVVADNQIAHFVDKLG